MKKNSEELFELTPDNEKDDVRKAEDNTDSAAAESTGQTDNGSIEEESGSTEKTSTEAAEKASSDASDTASTEVVVSASTEVAVTGSTEVVKADDEDSDMKIVPADGKKKEVDVPDDFAEEIEAFEHEKEDEEIMKNLSESINRQVEIDLVNRSINDDGAKQNVADAIETEKNPVKAFWKKLPKWSKVLSGIVAGMAVLVIFLAVTGLGKKLLIRLGSEYAADRVNYEEVSALSADDMNLYTVEQSVDGGQLNVSIIPLATATPVPSPSVSPTPSPTPIPEIEKKIVNILLLGEENIDSYSSRGRTDSILIATIDTTTNTLKFSSIMRDCLVEIPDFDMNRINAAYAIGGVSKLYDVIQANFGITPDNYALVHFSDFERIVDTVGGVDISLSAKEARYLNSTNYISKVENRNVVEGMNHMNGNQALGYCRVRKVATKENVNNDFGRTSRHREVVSAIFEQVKNKSYLELVEIANTCLPFVTTDLTADQINEYANMLVTIGGVNVKTEEMRIPIDKAYKYATYKEMSVLEINIDKNREALHDFIYGDFVNNSEN